MNVVTPNVIMREFKNGDEARFKELNLEWMNEFDKLEDSDFFYLDSPKDNIIDKGGKIFLMEKEGDVIGCACLIPESEPGVFEFGKFAVDKNHRGGGLGKRLMGEVIDWARNAGLKKLTLTSSEELKSAVSLYKKFGFELKSLPENVAYEKVDFYMELDLTDT